jgi:uncharacterized protein (DUF2164 family)
VTINKIRGIIKLMASISKTYKVEGQPNLVFINRDALLYHEKVRRVRAAAEAPLWEVFCKALLHETSLIMTEQAKALVEERARTLGLDFYAQTVFADEAVVRCSMPLTTEDIVFILD